MMGDSQKVPSTLPSGTLIGEFELLSPLARGGFGEIYRARQARWDREAAVKVLRPDANARFSEIERRFSREIDLVKRLQHPNIVQLYDFGRTGDGMLWMAMELVHGPTLGQVLNLEGRFSPARARAMTLQVLSALVEAHDRSIVHRDLKPANIMLTRVGPHTEWVKLLDFGIAKVFDPAGGAEAELTALGANGLGTPRYMAPEQIRSHQVGPHSDVYSVGLMLFEMVTGEPAIDGDLSADIIANQLAHAPVCPNWLADTDLAAILTKATAKDIAHRYPHAKDLYGALEALDVERMFAHADIPSSELRLRLEIPAPSGLHWTVEDTDNIERSPGAEPVAPEQAASDDDEDQTSPPTLDVGHALRTPLNKIIGYSEVLVEELEELGHPELVHDVAMITQAGWSMLRAVETFTALLVDQPHTQEPPAPSPPPEAAPTSPSTDQPQEPVAIVPAGEGSEQAKARLLLVDDDPGCLEVLARRLRSRPFDVSAVTSGASALARIEAEDFDLVVLDVMMPGLSGLETLTRLRATHDPAQLPVIIATALDTSSDVVQALRLGANDYVTKPLDFDVVLARINTQLALKRARDQILDLSRHLDAAQSQLTQHTDGTNITAWAVPISRDLCRMIGAREARLWLRTGGVLTCLQPNGGAPPGEHVLRRLGHRGGHLLEGDNATFAVAGFSGELYGVLHIDGPRVLWREQELELVGRFARQLGSALELQTTRDDLALAKRQRKASREEMRERGVELAKTCPQCGRCYPEHTVSCEDDGVTPVLGRLLPFEIDTRYQLERLSGEGAMGTVFRARDTRLSRTVAIKVLRERLFEDKGARERFAAEAKVIARIDHPNIIKVHDTGELAHGPLYMVTEFVQGEDLASVLGRHPRGAPRQIATLLRQAAAGLAAAHRAGVVHRDVKPGNILLVPDGDDFSVKVLDFSIAADLSDRIDELNPGPLLGTPAYMSPEQLMQRPLDARTDVYSLAAVGYLALTGRRLTRATDLWPIIVDVLHEVPPPVSTLIPAAPPEVDQGFAAGLAKDPADRPRDILHWAESLATHVERIPTESGMWAVAPG